jgi:hypothetical protein
MSEPKGIGVPMPLSDKADFNKVIPLASMMVSCMNKQRFAAEDSLCVIDTLLCFLAGGYKTTCEHVAEIVLERAKYIDAVRSTGEFKDMCAREEGVVVGYDRKEDLN